MNLQNTKRFIIWNGGNTILALRPEYIVSLLSIFRSSIINLGLLLLTTVLNYFTDITLFTVCFIFLEIASPLNGAKPM
jgi:hypothetical protein